MKRPQFARRYDIPSVPRDTIEGQTVIIQQVDENGCEVVEELVEYKPAKELDPPVDPSVRAKMQDAHTVNLRNPQNV